MIQRQDDGFPLDQSRVAYLRYLRRERRQSPRSEADADFQRAKSELIRLRIAEKQRDLIPLEEAIGHMEELIGMFTLGLTAGFAARCGGHDLIVRRAIDKAVSRSCAPTIAEPPAPRWPMSAGATVLG